MRAWRLVKTRLAETAFDGRGAQRHGGRWNSPLLRVVYASEHLSLAALEVLVHTQDSAALRGYSAIAIEFDPRLAIDVSPDSLPDSWREWPAPPALQAIGDDWIRSRRSAILRVPSVIVPVECNLLLNPEHPDFSRIHIKTPAPFELDARLRGAGRAKSSSS